METRPCPQAPLPPPHPARRLRRLLGAWPVPSKRRRFSVSFLRPVRPSGGPDSSEAACTLEPNPSPHPPEGADGNGPIAASGFSVWDAPRTSSTPRSCPARLPCTRPIGVGTRLPPFGRSADAQSRPGKPADSFPFSRSLPPHSLSRIPLAHAARRLRPLPPRTGPRVERNTFLLASLSLGPPSGRVTSMSTISPASQGALWGAARVVVPRRPGGMPFEGAPNAPPFHRGIRPSGGNWRTEKGMGLQCGRRSGPPVVYSEGPCAPNLGAGRPALTRPGHRKRPITGPVMP